MKTITDLMICRAYRDAEITSCVTALELLSERTGQSHTACLAVAQNAMSRGLLKIARTIKNIAYAHLTKKGKALLEQADAPVSREVLLEFNTEFQKAATRWRGMLTRWVTYDQLLSPQTATVILEEWDAFSSRLQEIAEPKGKEAPDAPLTQFDVEWGDMPTSPGEWWRKGTDDVITKVKVVCHFGSFCSLHGEWRWEIPQRQDVFWSKVPEKSHATQD